MDGAFLSGTPAFVLGNSPGLPDDLSGLSGKFTVGVNRILRSGFTPTAIMWVDGTVYDDDGPEIDGSGSLLVCDESVKRRQFHIGLKTHVGDNAFKFPATDRELCVNGNTGCCAARWVLALGCRPVYLVGMEATYVGCKTDFYGENKWHHNSPDDYGTLMVMRGELQRLQVDFGDDVRIVTNAEALEWAAGTARDWDQDILRVRLRTRLTHGT